MKGLISSKARDDVKRKTLAQYKPLLGSLQEFAHGTRAWP
jgi:hypothetical protein